MNSQMPDYRAANQALWDERAPLHFDSAFYDVPGFRVRRDSLRPFEADEVGDVAGKSLIHLQCHIGLDTLSWAVRGAHVTGVDFSQTAVDAATGLAADMGLEARFLTCDVYDAVAAVEGRGFDVVYTGIGALCWLPDLRRWARTAAALLNPGGMVYLLEFHPITEVLDDAEGRTVVGDYFDATMHVSEVPGSYADWHTPTVHNTSVEYRHSLGEVVTALAEAGLRLEFLHERPVTMFRRFDNLVALEDGQFEAPAGAARTPLTYSLRAVAG